MCGPGGVGPPGPPPCRHHAATDLLPRSGSCRRGYCSIRKRAQGGDSCGPQGVCWFRLPSSSSQPRSSRSRRSRRVGASTARRRRPVSCRRTATSSTSSTSSSTTPTSTATAQRASDLEQMPHLLDFLTRTARCFTNDHTILISHTAGGILSSLTGSIPTGTGQTVSNSYGYFTADGDAAFTSSFKYWTSPVDGTDDSAPEHDHGRREDDAGALGAVHPCGLRRRRRRHREHRAREQLDRHRAETSTNVYGDGSPEAPRQPARAAQRTDRLRRDRDPLRAGVVEQVRRQRERAAATRCRTSPAATPASRGCSARSTSTRRSPGASPA